MEQRANFLALCLLDAMEDEDPKMIEDVLNKYDVNPNIIIQDRGISPIHYSCGMPNIQLAEKTTAQLLERGANPNVCSEDNMTPMHVAAIHGRASIVKMLLKKGGKLDVLDVDRKTPILYAIHECHFDVVKVMQDHIFEQKYQKKTQDLSTNKPDTPKILKNNHLSINQMESKKFTPNRINYNYDVTSPYYINITHRRKPDPCTCCTPKINDEEDTLDNNTTSNDTPPPTQNIFALTKENIKELSKDLSEETNTSPKSLINAWREKVQRAKSKQSILEKFNDIDSLLSGIMENEELDFTNTLLDLNKENETNEEETLQQKQKKSFLNTSFGRIVKTIEEVPTEIEDSFYTVPDVVGGGGEPAEPQAQSTQMNETNFIKSPRNTEYIVQMTEAYVHTDDENGLVFYETKLLNNQINRDSPKKNIPNNQVHDESVTSVSTNLTVPLDYETEALRAELTHFGDPPGPITKSTKKLYIKRLTKYKRNTSQMKAQFNVNEENKTKFSVELDRTIRREEIFERITEYRTFEQELVAYFQNNPNTKRLREGHLKQSFIYMLIDPRISNNLPGESSFLTKFEVWKRFLMSIFYVGKGKTSRPYSHLYDAMKKYSRLHGTNQTKGNGLKTISIESFKSPTNKSYDSKKLDKILDIWSNGKGVVCLHVFHNILPAEAYTREAAIIDALSLQHLTNMKRGDYYGPAQSWTMRAKKCLGVGLLHKAMQIYVAEGESQLSPSDLI
ncbi:ankyrin repeat and LEM domain-containing protein 1 [Episyrphus balteatus]|uniref:ankyrin repeat and LEM domain-containing protein 1 n=1 Tax=Episyrphus balteatus TaxID=286459 RepID=UPI002485B4CB|nr:ankyrin repeat and LEM domain-containing protein 1 [Episyrphus balteatus]